MVKEKSKSKKSQADAKRRNNKKKDPADGWVTFCDFHEITHIVIKEATVTIFKQDNKMMVRHTHTHKDKSVAACAGDFLY